MIIALIVVGIFLYIMGFGFILRACENKGAPEEAGLFMGSIWPLVVPVYLGIRLANVCEKIL